jgi:hypothetical protein
MYCWALRYFTVGRAAVFVRLQEILVFPQNCCISSTSYPGCLRGGRGRNTRLRYEELFLAISRLPGVNYRYVGCQYLERRKKGD